MKDEATITQTPRRRWRQFSLRTFLLVAIGVGVWLGIDANRRAALDKRRDLARHIAAHELMRIHAVSMENRPGSEAFDRSMLDGITSQFVQPDWEYKFIPAADLRFIPQAAAPADPFEKRSLANFRAGEDEIWQTSRNGAARYAKAIRAGATCSNCHSTTTNGGVGVRPAKTLAPGKLDELLGVIIVDLPPR